LKNWCVKKWLPLPLIPNASACPLAPAPSLLPLIIDGGVAALIPVGVPPGRLCVGIGKGDGDGMQAGAILEYVGVDRCYACGDADAGKTGAVLERPFVDGPYAWGNGYTGKAGTILECEVADGRYGCGDGDALKAGAI